MRINARNQVFDVAVTGPPDAPPVLLLHGFPQHSGMWDLVSAPLLGAGLRTVAVDQRGYSPGARPAAVEAYRLQECVEDAVALLDALGIDAAHVVGHDWGALVGWQMAAVRPDRVRTLTAASVPHPAALARAMATDDDQRQRSSYIRLFREAGHAEQVLLRDDADALRRVFTGCPVERIDRYLIPMREPELLTAALNWYRALPDGGFGDPGPVRVPTTYVWTSADVAIGPHAARACAEHVTGPYRFLRLHGVSHWVADEAPGALADAILDRVVD